MKYTKTLQKAIDSYNLKLIHTGSLSYEGSRYLKSEPMFEWPEDDSEGEYILEFNYFRPDAPEWLTFGKRCRNRAEALAIKEKEFGRRLWDSAYLFFVRGEKIWVLCL